jgi:anthranilate phosphoribosyltransferase
MTPSQKLSRNVLARRDNTMEVWYGMPKQFCPLAQTLTLRQCDIVGTGGDSHNTYNVSTTSSILASALLMMAKHGNNASTSKSGSADLLLAASPAPVIAATTEKTLPDIYSRTNYAFCRP